MISNMVRITWTRLKREVFIEGPGLVVLGVHQWEGVGKTLQVVDF